MNDPLGQSCRAQISFTCSSIVGLSFRRQSSESSMVILYSWLYLSEIAMPNIQKFLIIGLLYLCSVLSGFSLSSVFWRSSMYAASVILLQTLCQEQLHAMLGFILYYRFLWISRDFILWISTLWISRDFISFAS